VIQAINRDGAAWLSAPELKEARRYVNRIFSFCDAFEHVSSDSREPEESPRDGTHVREWPAQLAPLPPALIQRVMHENET
jgi:hypothetical protein